MPVPHEEMRRIIKRRIRGLEGTERVRVLKEALADLPGYYQGPYGQLRKWVLEQIAESETKARVRHQESFFLARQGAAQVALVGRPNAGKSSLLHALTGRHVVVADYAFTTLRPVEGMVDCHGAKVQLLDLPGLIEAAAEGKGDGRSVLAAIRVASAVLRVIPLTPEGVQESHALAAELAREGIALPTAWVATKSDLAGAKECLAALREAHPEARVVACSVVAARGLEDVRALVWDLTGLIRVYCRPRGQQTSPVPTVLPRGSTVMRLATAINRSWPGRVRAAHVSGPSARFDAQQVGMDHVLADGDTVELVLR